MLGQNNWGKGRQRKGRVAQPGRAESRPELGELWAYPEMENSSKASSFFKKHSYRRQVNTV